MFLKLVAQGLGLFRLNRATFKTPLASLQNKLQMFLKLVAQGLGLFGLNKSLNVRRAYHRIRAQLQPTVL